MGWREQHSSNHQNVAVFFVGCPLHKPLPYLNFRR